MGDSDTEGATSQRGRFGKAAERLGRWYRVALGVRPDPRREPSARSRWPSASRSAFAARHGQAVRRRVLFAGSPIDLDLSLRALSLGWFESERTIPVTIVDIDAATNRAGARR